MTTVVIPFRSGGKTRLPAGIRVELSLAMLGDVIEAAAAVAPVRLATDDTAARRIGTEFGVEVVRDPGNGQGAAVAAALVGLDGLCLIVNADLPFISRGAVEELAALCPALVAAADGTTNALSLAEPMQFAPLYGPGSAARFAAAGFSPVSIPELEHDVDTIADLDRRPFHAGRRTTLVLNRHRVGLAPAS